MTQLQTKRFTIEEYHRLTQLGFLVEGDRVELIRGELIQMAAKGTPHSVCNTKLIRELEKLLRETAVVRCQEPVTLYPNSEPEPDATIVRGQPDDYLVNHPQPEDIFLLIEVSDSTLKYDQTEKLSLYAENQIQNYWIFNLVTYELERYSQPYCDTQGKYNYRNKQISLTTETVLLPGFGNLSLNLNSVFPSI